MTEKLRVRMFGVFSASYGETDLTFGRQRNSKFSQLFQLLMTRPGLGFSKKSIAGILYGQEKVENTNASLNNTIFRLRRYLKESPLPPGEYLILKNGMLCFNDQTEVESDAWSFECTVHEFEQEHDRQKKIALCGKAYELYQGEFLPQLSNEMWVIEKSRVYHEMYSRILEYLLRSFEEDGDYKRIGSLAGRASKIHPGEGWENWQLESLLASGSYREAEQVYQEAAARVKKEGGFLSQKQQERFHKIAVRIRHPERMGDDIAKYLMERDPRGGAYSCTLSGFSDCFHMLKRVTAREGSLLFCLLLCTILDPNGRPANSLKCCKTNGEKLRATFQAYLRKGDIYAKYSENQYLLLCIGVDKENALHIGARIDTDFRKRCGGRGGIQCRLLDDGGLW